MTKPKPSKTSQLGMFAGIMPKQEQPAEITPTPIPAAPVEAAPAQEKRKHAPVSVYLSDEQRETIETIAKATGQTRHAVLQYAVRRVCNEWKQNIWPEMEVKPKLK